MKTYKEVIDELKKYDGEPIKIMEVCGTHTSSIFKHGIRSLISPKIRLISGPGCPVCVTSTSYIDRLVEFSMQENHCVLTFGDMMKVKGTKNSLTGAKALGGKVKILYSPLAAVKEAKDNLSIQYVFAAVGFETTTPVYSLMLEEIIKNDIRNLKLMTSLKTILPAVQYICENEEKIDAFLCPGHVSVITGSAVYKELAAKYHKPFVVAGFEAEHILAAVYEIVSQLVNHKYEMKNMYISAVTEEGNTKALDMISKYFQSCDDIWRGIGLIKNSALKLKDEYRDYDAGRSLNPSDQSDIIINEENDQMPEGCSCKEVILGRIDPAECPLFSKVCTPLNAVGPCMVSTEGACGIWYKNRGVS